MAKKGKPENLTPFNSETGAEAGKKSKRGRSMKTILNEYLSNPVFLDKIKDKKIKEAIEVAREISSDAKEYDQVIVATTIAKALQGDKAAMELVWGHKEGKPTQPIQQDNELKLVLVDNLEDEKGGE